VLRRRGASPTHIDSIDTRGGSYLCRCLYCKPRWLSAMASWAGRRL
jgi:hypothetical protein